MILHDMKGCFSKFGCVDIPVEHLRTLAAAVDAGTLDRAAAQLGITPSAVSQRIRVSAPGTRAPRAAAVRA